MAFRAVRMVIILFGHNISQRCIATGYPLANIQWLKDGQPLRTGSRVRLLTKEHIKITSVTKEDRGMYQCFVRNDYDAVQSTAEMSLGGKLLFVFLCFAHLIYVSFRCGTY